MLNGGAGASDWTLNSFDGTAAATSTFKGETAAGAAGDTGEDLVTFKGETAASAASDTGEAWTFKGETTTGAASDTGDTGKGL
mmetsp:Transcript_78617/g.200102  ORF Transcript_78617/g.200102 Transcript_78617/m.200102 type:complete len:83 (-) Transcript_78617:460-708(-)